MYSKWDFTLYISLFSFWSSRRSTFRLWSLFLRIILACTVFRGFWWFRVSLGHIYTLKLFKDCTCEGGTRDSETFDGIFVGLTSFPSLFDSFGFSRSRLFSFIFCFSPNCRILRAKSVQRFPRYIYLSSSILDFRRFVSVTSSKSYPSPSAETSAPLDGQIMEIGRRDSERDERFENISIKIEIKFCFVKILKLKEK